MTFPEISETPTMLKDRVLLSGVKTTLKRVAEKLEFDMHGLSDLDSIMRSAAAVGSSADSADSAPAKNEGRILRRSSCGIERVFGVE